MIQSAVLQGGFPLLVDRVRGTSVASVGFWFRVGSRDENRGEEGHAHFLEHMLFKGTSNRTARQIALDIDRVGGFLNAFTEKEVTCYHCTVPRESLGLAVEVLSDMIRNALLDPAELEKEKNVVASEILAAEDVAEDVAHDLYLEYLFPGQQLARHITGTADEVRAITADALRVFHHRRYGRSTLMIGVASDLTLPEARDLVERHLDGWDAPGEAAGRAPAQPDRCWSFHRGRSEQIHFYTGIAAPGGNTLRDYYVSLVFSTLVGESMSSRLFQSLRETHALCYSVASYRTQLSDAYLWTIYASTTPQAGPDFLRRLGEELADLRRSPPTLTEVDDAKSHLRGSLILAQEDTEARMKRMVRQALMVGRSLEYDESLEHLERVKREDVAAVAEDYLRAERFNLLVYGGGGHRRFRRFHYSF